MKSTNIFKLILVLIIIGLVYLKWQAATEIQTFTPSPTPVASITPSPITQPNFQDASPSAIATSSAKASPKVSPSPINQTQ